MSEFHELVLKDVKSEVSEAEESVLLADIDEWHAELLILKKDVESQFASKKAESLALGKKGYVAFHEWRSGAVRFKNSIEERLSEVKVMIKERNRDAPQPPDPGSFSHIAEKILVEVSAIRVLLESLK